jgi:endogenous inhibitor of DNA gyrase (YacG/DUF329 family)
MASFSDSDIPNHYRYTKCPLCKKKTQIPFRPFCSERCRVIDLGKWVLESYRVPAEEAQESLDLGAEE